MITKSVDFIAGFINQVKRCKERTLAAIFLKRPEIVDEVLEKIECDDVDLIYLPYYRPELAESHERLFKVMDEIKIQENKKWLLSSGVHNLFNAKRYNSVIPLINALEKRLFKGRSVKDIAIQQAFEQGARRNQHIVEEFHEHPAITSDKICQRID